MASIFQTQHSALNKRQEQITGTQEKLTTGSYQKKKGEGYPAHSFKKL